MLLKVRIATPLCAFCSLLLRPQFTHAHHTRILFLEDSDDFVGDEDDEDGNDMFGWDGIAGNDGEVEIAGRSMNTPNGMSVPAMHARLSSFDNECSDCENETGINRALSRPHASLDRKNGRKGGVCKNAMSGVKKLRKLPTLFWLLW